VQYVHSCGAEDTTSAPGTIKHSTAGGYQVITIVTLPLLLCTVTSKNERKKTFSCNV